MQIMSSNHTILIVDDDLTIRKTLTDILQRKGFSPIAVEKGKPALEIVRSKTLAVVLIDLILSDINGLDLIKEIKKYSPSTECIILTGEASQSSAIKAVNLGAYGYIQKPFDVEQLVIMVSRAIEKRESIEALRKSEERYRSLFDGIPVGNYRTTPQGKILDVNRAMVEMLGYPTRESLLTVTVTDLYKNPDDRAHWQTTMEREGIVHGFELQLKRFDGSIIWVSDDARAVRDENGHLLHYAGILRNITEHKQLEEKLHKTQMELTRSHDLLLSLGNAAQAVQRCHTLEEVYQNIGKEFAKHQINGGVYILSKDQKYLELTYLNLTSAFIKKAEKLTGFSAQGFQIPIKKGNFFDNVITERKSLFHSQFEKVLIEILPRKLHTFINKLLNMLNIKQGIIAPLIVQNKVFGLLVVTGLTLSLSGERVITTFSKHVSMTMENILVKKERERLFEMPQMLIMIAKPDTTIVRVSIGWQDTFGYLQDEMEGKSYLEFIHPDDIPKTKTETNDLTTGNITQYFENRYRKKKGEYRILRWAADFDPLTGNIYGVAQDITERKLANEAVRQSERRLKNAEQLANLGHWQFDLKTNSLFWSNQTYNIFDLDPKKFKVTYENFLEKVHPDDRDYVNKVYTESVNNKKKYNITHRIKLEDGTEKYVEERWITKYDENSSPLRTIGTVQDITERVHIEEKLKRSQENLRKLSSHLQTIRENDRAYIAREIHDDFGQSLAALKINLSLLEKDLKQHKEIYKANTMKATMKDMKKIINETVSKVKQFITDLRPEILETLGLLDALEWQFEEFQKRFDILGEFNCNTTKIDLIQHRSLAIFRIFQEALTNIARHAKATKVNVEIMKQKHQLMVTIKDNGIGFLHENIENGKFGILGMRERANFCQGELNIKSHEGCGTTVLIQIPI